MCMTVKEMNVAMEEIREWKRIKEEAEDNIAALNRAITEFLLETAACQAFDKEGKQIRRFIGDSCKATLSMAERKSIDKEKVKELLSKKDYQKVFSVSTYPVLRVS